MRTAIGIVRVSATAGREGEAFASPHEQRHRITADCERRDISLLRTIDEMDVSGGTPLAKRHGLRGAVEAIEAGEADVLVVAYFDRLVRSITVQEEIVRRVETAGGRVLAVDFGEITHDTAAQWLSGTMLGAVNEYTRRSIRERTRGAQERAVARGVPPWPNVTPGYQRKGDGRYEPSPAAPAVREAFAMRAEGARVADVRTHLERHGVKLSYHGVCYLLASRVVLGEIHFGKLENLGAHEPIVDRGTWDTVQRVKVPRGRAAKSPRLLARLGVLECGSCGSLMVIGGQNRWPYYRCNRVREDCPQRVAISAPMAEGIVVAAVREALAGIEEGASADDDARDAEEALDRAQADLDGAIRAFSVVDGEPVALERLAQLRDARDHARARAQELRGLSRALTVSVSDWEALSFEGRRELLRLVVARAVVMPGRGPGRVSIELVK